MSYLTYADAKALSKGLLEFKKYAAAQPSANTIFLSHSWKDADLIPGVERFFAQFEATTYVDLKDESLPEVPSAETAQILRANINICPRLVVLLTPKSKDSKWVPWELGIGDGLKGVWRVAILPLVPGPQETEWVKQEYLGLYPRINKGPLQGSTGEVWKVSNPRTNQAWTLQEWLHNPKVGA